MDASTGLLSPHFSLGEMTQSQAAVRAGISNTPSRTVLANMKRLAERLELVRAALGHRPILISSGYRSPRVNAIVGGAANSAHVKGLAADFTCPGFGAPEAVCRRIIESGIVFDQLIYEGSWVHFGLTDAELPARRQVLTAVFEPHQPVRYLKGLA